MLETDLLIIGAGPAGASLAAFLTRYNLNGILISSAPGPARTPRAHLTNCATLESIRDLDYAMYDECLRLGNMGENIEHYRWCETLTGEEYGRVSAWGLRERRSDYENVSSCPYIDLPQSLLEPILLRKSTDGGWVVRYNTTLTGFEEEETEPIEKSDVTQVKGGEKRRIVASIIDDLTGQTYQIRTQFLFGADGGRSKVAKIIDLPFTSIPGGGFAYNILFRADLSDAMQHCKGNLHIIMGLDRDDPFICAARIVKPWTEWVFVVLPKGPNAPNPKRSHAEWTDIIRKLVGKQELEVDVLDVSGWAVNETSADVISKGNIFCLGDSIHRHPPTLGLGSNVAIGDAYNLAWKVALVLQGRADPNLLSTYNAERQPVAAHLVTESNDVHRFNYQLWPAFGVLPYGTEKAVRIKSKEQLYSNTPEGRARRKAISKGIRGLDDSESNQLGITMGQRYDSSAVYAKDEPHPFTPGPTEAIDIRRNYDPCTFPGRRLPHALLGKGKPRPGPLISTMQLAGRGRFTLFTGIGGIGWRDAVDRLGLDIKVFEVGLGLEWHDVYRNWEDRRGVEEDGCVLVRPDCFVAWRAQSSGNEEARLAAVMKSILGPASPIADLNETATIGTTFNGLQHE